jgi:hypothetical protein
MSNARFLEESVALLERTPTVLNALLRDLPDVWTNSNEGEGSWSPYVVVGHLIHAEKADWIPRLQIILEHGESRVFDPFDRDAQFRESAGKSLAALLDEWHTLRAQSLHRLRALLTDPAWLDRKGTHPAFGTVTARQLLATWTAHDMAHVVQIARVLAKRYKAEVGPWARYLSVMS